MDIRNDILNYLLEKYYQPNLSGEVARNLDIPEEKLIDQIALINREKNGLVILKESMGKNKYVISLRPNSEEEIKSFLSMGGFVSEQANNYTTAPSTAPAEPTVIVKEKTVRTGNSGKWIAIIALLIALAALGLAVYNHLLFGGYL